ncbi:MAG: hypothetical protein ACTHV2_07690 [Brachybacterium sp.]|uniref:hypothetical protein n=1 Tax=Brachybacterium sp. TaxID=1891286 RepID=UPI0026525D3E|nr:hypothetical protein [Brachybacterium sp.]MDN6301654.1 hypothetical protein [Brachybacterium sp.]MDN6328508.1 hypothetical protein [Brachybacterium sp.]
MGSTDDTPLLPGDWGAVEQERDRVLDARRQQKERDLAWALVVEFEDWLREDEHEPDEVMTVTRTVRNLLQFKDDVLGSTDPLEWSEDLLRSLVSEVFPQKLPEGLDDPRDAAVDLLPFVSFLEETKRWRKRPLRGYEARMLLFSLAYPAPEDWGPGVVIRSS